MDFIIAFFRDFLDGPVYVFVTVVNSILICSCIGYLGERYLNKQANKVNKHKTLSKKNSNNKNVKQENSLPLNNGNITMNNVPSTNSTNSNNVNNITNTTNVANATIGNVVNNTTNSINNVPTNTISNYVPNQQVNNYNPNVVQNVVNNTPNNNGVINS